MGLRPTQGDENSLKGTAFRPSITITITITITVALATEGKHFRHSVAKWRDLLFVSLPPSSHADSLAPAALLNELLLSASGRRRRSHRQTEEFPESR
jgi:hypothetical protein